MRSSNEALRQGKMNRWLAEDTEGRRKDRSCSFTIHAMSKSDHGSAVSATEQNKPRGEKNDTYRLIR